VRGFLMQEKQGQSPALSFEELFVNLELQSLIRLAPVIEELRLVKPYVNLVRQPDLKYSFQDLIDEFTSGPPGPTPRFALYNIQIIDGKIDFDDQPKQTKHAVSALKIGVPVISSLPAHLDIKVKPEFSALIDGAPFHLAGDSTTPFKDSLESTLAIKIDKLEIAKFLEYSPVALNFKLPSGQLNGKVTVSFKSAPKATPVLALSGDLNVNAGDRRRAAGQAAQLRCRRRRLRGFQQQAGTQIGEVPGPRSPCRNRPQGRIEPGQSGVAIGQQPAGPGKKRRRQAVHLPNRGVRPRRRNDPLQR
jgi:uncharacterized protein involved in outer membrane biogenesis